ncbi:MAG: EamA family transporter [Actinobacteria bacterium]|nr:EamA family transporter [Actinomycetota bacterium]
MVIGGIASTQFGAAFADKLFDRAGPAGVVLLRLAFAALIVLIVARPRVRGRTRADWRVLIGFGLVLGGMNWSFYEALDRLPLGVAVTIEFAGPLVVTIAGSRRALDLIWAVFAATGVALLALDHSHGRSSLGGVGFAAVAGVCWAAYILLAQRAGAVLPGVQALAVALAVGTLLVIPAGWHEGGSRLLQPAVLGAGLAVALLSSVVPYSLEIIALRRLPAAAFGLLMSVEPAVAALAGVLVLDERLSARVIVALLLVVAASAGTTTYGRRTAVDAEVAPSLVHPD